MSIYYHLSIKLFVGFVVLFIAARFIGGRELKKLNVFDFITAIVLSELVGNVLYQKEVDALHMSYALVFWTLLIYIIDKIKMKLAKTRKLFEGVPDMVIEEGEIKKEVLRKNRVDLNELLALLREKGYFSIGDVKYAFLETNGNISVIDKKTNAFPHPLVLDGEYSKLAFDTLGKDQEWLLAKIQEQGYTDIAQIFYAEYQEGDNLYIQPQPEHTKRKSSSETGSR